MNPDLVITEQLAEECAMGDEHATRFLLSMLDVAHLWDDLVDRDRIPTDSEVNKAFTDMLITLPANPFFRRYQEHLHPIVVNSIINWRVSNQLENGRSEIHRLEIAYILRSSFVDLWTQVAYIMGGMDHAVAMGFKVRRGTHHEGFELYRKNLGLGEAARNGKG